MDTNLSHETTMPCYSCTRYVASRTGRGEDELQVLSYNLLSRTCHSWSMLFILLFVATLCFLDALEHTIHFSRQIRPSRGLLL
jgi:hypothetical protein